MRNKLNPPTLKLRRTSNKIKNKGLILPLYFGWQIRVIIEKVSDLRQHIVGPFKKYWHFMTVVIMLVTATSAFLILKQYNDTQAATYYFTQSDWSGGASTTDIAIHGTDNSTWDKYQSADSNIDFSTNNQISIASTTQTLTHTLSADFANGTSVGVSTSSDEISLDLP